MGLLKHRRKAFQPSGPVSVSDDFESYSVSDVLGDQSKWTAIENTLVIATGNVLEGGSSTSDNTALYSGASFSEDHKAIVEMSTSGAHSAGVLCRANTDVDYYLANMQSSGQIRCGVKIGGTWTKFHETDIGTISSGDRIRLDVTGSGSATRLKVFHAVGAGLFNTVSGMGSVDPGSGKYLSGGSPGILIYKNTSKLDNWEASDI